MSIKYYISSYSSVLVHFFISSRAITSPCFIDVLSLEPNNPEKAETEGFLLNRVSGSEQLKIVAVRGSSFS